MYLLPEVSSKLIGPDKINHGTVESKHRDTWVAQLVKHLTLDLSSGLDLRVGSSRPVLGSSLGMEPTLKKKKKSEHRSQYTKNDYQFMVQTL